MAMKSLFPLSVSLLIGGAAYLALSGSASAITTSNPGLSEMSAMSGQSSLIEDVHRYRRHYRPRGGVYFSFRYGPRYRSRRHGFGHFYDGWWYSYPWWAGAGYYAPRRYYGPPRRHYRRGNAHVRWCRNRYRSYNPRTDQFLGYDGYYHYCNSPYR